MKNDIKLMHKEWITYFKACYPNDCSTIQRQEMERAFYAGALVIYKILGKMGNFKEDEQIKAAMVSMLYKEIEVRCREMMQEIHVSSGGNN